MGGPPMIQNNFWGTTSPTIIDAMIWDFNDDITLASITYKPILTTAPVTAYPFLVDVALTSTDGKVVSIVGAETVTFTVSFNRDMDQAVAPAVSFGPVEPYTDYMVSPGTLTKLNDTKFAVTGAWKDARTWVGSFKVNPITGDGYQYIRVAGAVAANDPWLVTGVDSARFRFEIITSGTESMNLAAGGGEGKVILTWTQNDFELLTGYNLYRSTKATEGFTRINRTLIAKQTTGYMDTTVNPGLTYYYKFTVVKSDGTESDGFSNVASAAAVDTIAPVISHMPLTASPAGLAASLTAQVTDNVGVREVLLYYRTIGAATYTVRAMTNTSGSTYAATIEGSVMTAPGVDYYLTATDGISPVYFGRPETPYQIRVLDTPVITGVSPVTGGASGGTSVTLAGANFKTGASVSFGGALASSVVVVNANQITCTTPTHFPSAVDVVVSNPGAVTGALLRAYTFTSDQASLSLPVLSAGQNTVVQIPLSAATIQGLLSADLTVTYNATVLRARTATTGSLTSGWSLALNTATAGQVHLVLANATSVTGTGTLAVLEFDVVGVPGTSSTLALATVKLNDGAIVQSSASGTLNVQVVYTVSGSATHWKSWTAIPAVQLQLTGERAFGAPTGASGAYTVASVPAGNYVLRPSKSDDANGITAYDASLVLQHVAGLITLSGYPAIAADVDKSGTISALDAAYILERAATPGTSPFQGAGVLWEFSPASRNLSSLSSNLSGQDFTGVLLGDVSGNWVSTEAGMAAPAAPVVPTTAIDLRLAESAPASDHTLIANLAIAPKGQDVYSLDAVLAYDATKGTPRTPVLGSAASGWLVSSNTATSGEIRVSMASAHALSTDAALFGVVFDLLDAAHSVGLTVKSASINESLLANVQYALQVTKDGAGSGTVTSQPVAITDAVGTAMFNAGTLVTLTATPAIGSRFTGWSGATSGTALTTTITLDAARQVTATFMQLAPVTLTWTDPGAITYGTPLSVAQYNATASLQGTFAYTPALGTVLNAGTGQALTATFTATDTQYLPVTKTVHIDVAKASQALSFSPVTGLVAGGSAVTLQATASSGLAVTFRSSNPAVLAISGGTATPLALGNVVVTASQAGDSNRLAAPDASQTVTIAPSPAGPTMALSMLSDKAVTADNILSITGQVQSPNGVGSVTVNGETALVQPDGNFRHALRLTPGSNTIGIHVLDAAGHATDSSRTVTLDETVPKVTITTPPDNATLASSTVHVTGQVLPAGTGTDALSTVTYALGGGTTQAVILSGSAFAFDLVPNAGLNSLEITANTVGGKQSKAKASFLQQPGFSLAITEPAKDIATTESSYLLKGTITDNSTPVTATITMGSLQYTPTVLGGAFQQRLPLDSNQVWSILVSGQDAQNRVLTVQRNIIRIPLALPTFTMDDASAAARFSSGATTATTGDLSKYDVAPLVNAVPAGDGKIDVEDLVVIFRKAMGLPL